jgi:hypothetical protein
MSISDSAKEFADKVLEVTHSKPRPPIRITRAHHTDLVCAAMNDTSGATQKILDRMTAEPGFQIDEQPVEGVHYFDQSVNFMYPHEIGLIEAVLPPDVVYPNGLPVPTFADLRPSGPPLSTGADGLSAADRQRIMESIADGIVPGRGMVTPLFFNPETADEMAFHDYAMRDMRGVIPTIAFDVERTLDGEKVADYVRKVMMSDTYGKFKPTIVVDSYHPELFGGSRRTVQIPGLEETSIEPAKKPKTPPSGLLMKLLGRI